MLLCQALNRQGEEHHKMQKMQCCLLNYNTCEAVNGEFFDNYENAIMVHISHLRDKIEDDSKNPRYIKNVRGLGYKIEKI